MPGAGFTDAAERLTLDDRLVRWDDLVGVVDAEVLDWGTDYDQSAVRFIDQRFVEQGGRWVLFGDADGDDRVTVRVTASRYRTPTDAALVFERHVLPESRGGRLSTVTESESVADGLLATRTSFEGFPQASAHLLAGDRRYEVEIETTSSDAELDLAEEVLGSVAARLERDGLLDPPPAPVVTEISPDEFLTSALIDAPAAPDWVLRFVGLGIDEWTGGVLLDVAFGLPGSDSTSAIIGLGLPPADFVSAFAPDRRDQVTAAWSSWAATATSYDWDEPEAEEWSVYSLWADGDVSLLVRPANDSFPSESGALQTLDGLGERLDIWVDVARHLREALTPGVSSATIDAEQRVLRAMDGVRGPWLGGPSSASLPPAPPFSKRLVALGGVGSDSPVGADGEWHLLHGGEPDDLNNEARLIHFTDPAASASSALRLLDGFESAPIAGLDNAVVSGFGTDSSGAGRAVVAADDWVAEIIVRVGADVGDDLVGLELDAQAAAIAAAWVGNLRYLALI